MSLIDLGRVIEADAGVSRAPTAFFGRTFRQRRFERWPLSKMPSSGLRRRAPNEESQAANLHDSYLSTDGKGKILGGCLGVP
jgi:hypothetical protein